MEVTYEAMEDNLHYINNWWSWKFKSRTGTRGAAVIDWLSGSVPTGQAPLVRTAEEFQTEWKHLFIAPASFRLSTLLINDEFLIKKAR